MLNRYISLKIIIKHLPSPRKAQKGFHKNNQHWGLLDWRHPRRWNLGCIVSNHARPPNGILAHGTVGCGNYISLSLLGVLYLEVPGNSSRVTKIISGTKRFMSPFQNGILLRIDLNFPHFCKCDTKTMEKCKYDHKKPVCLDVKLFSVQFWLRRRHHTTMTEH